MQISSKLFVLLSSVVGTVLIAAEPCARSGGGYGVYDMVACNECAKNGKGKGECCDWLYRHSFGRDDDDFIGNTECYNPGDECTAGDAKCLPGLTCIGNNSKNYFTGILTETCVLNTDDPNAHPDAHPYTGPVPGSLVPNSSSTGITTLQGVSSFVFVAGAAAMIAMKVVRHRGLLRRHQYSEVDVTATCMDV